MDKKWVIADTKLTKQQSIPVEDIIKVILRNRHILTPEQVEEYRNPRLANISFQTVAISEPDVTVTTERIRKAIRDQEQIIIYGDYDVDGITGAAILWETLYGLGAKVLPYIPHRVDEGYGLSKKGIINLRTKIPDVKLIITVDNGIVASEAVDFANEEGLEVIITDHHVRADEDNSLPKALAVVHTTMLCGAGVAWLLSQHLKKTFGTYSLTTDDHVELAALGTIADLVPLTGANRTLVKAGLKALQETKRKGLLALFTEAEIPVESIGVYQVGHVIAPRLNATGRMESAMDSLRLLCTKDTERARELAGLLGRVNRERQIVMLQAAEHASLSVKTRKELKKLLMVSHETYPEGVIGLVAGRLVEEYYRPAIVIAKGEKTSKGSVRSINGFNIIEFLRNSAELFVNVGGHPMAAGFTVETEKLALLQETLEQLAEAQVADESMIRTLKVDAVLPLSLMTTELYHALQELEPFGMANPEPTFVSENVEIKDLRVLGKEGKHLRLLLQQEYGEVKEAIAFGMGEKASEINPGDCIDIAYTVDENTWQGRTKLQLKIKDIKKTYTYK